MKKSALMKASGSALLFCIALNLFCVGFDSPSSPDKTCASVVFISSNAKIYEGDLVDSVGKEIQIGTALYLPDNFDSVAIDIMENGSTITNTVFKEFKADYFKDTVWVKYTFLKPGIKNVTITPYSTPVRPTIGATITILGVEQIPLDSTPPILTLISPSDTTVYISADTFTLDFLCSDPSGIASVYAVMDSTTFQSTQKNGHYLIELGGFVRGDTNVITVTATDSSASGNSVSRKLYFNYQKNGYSITYQKSSDESGDLPIDSRMYQSGEQVIVPANTGNLVKNGYTFTGWNTNTDGNGALYTSGSVLTVGNADVVLYAQWTADSSATFTLLYNGNGNSAGAAPIDTNKYKISAPVTVRNNTGSMVKPNATFTGWNTKPDGSGTAYACGVTFVMGSANVVLYAQWTIGATYSVTYNGNGNTSGTVPIDVNKYAAAAIITVKSNAGSLTKTGAMFKGWNTASDGGGTAYAVGDTVAIGRTDVTLYAYWTTNPTYSVVYDRNGAASGSVPVDANRYELADTVTVKDNTGLLVKTGAAFAGWNTMADGSGTTYNAGAVFVMGSADDTLFAKWKQVQTYVLIVTAIDGSITKSPDLPTYDSSTVVTLTPVPSSGYHFTGWSGAVTGTANPATIIMNNTASVTATFAKNQANSFSLTILAANGTVKKTPDLPQYDSGSVVGLKASPAAGFKFADWSGDAAGTTDSIAVIMSDAKSITASFTPLTYQLTVSAASGGTITAPASSQATVNHGAATTITATPDAGYRFTGWTVTSGTATFGDASSASTSVTLSSGNATVSAGFTRITYVLTVNTETGGTISAPASPATVNHGMATTITATPGAGYSFNGWVVTSGSAAIPDLYLATTTATLTSGNAEIKAQWTTIPYSITYNLNEGQQAGGSYPSTYTVNTSTITLPSPTRTAYVFDGWYDNSNFIGDKITSIPKGSTGYKHLSAKWVIKDIDGNEYTEVKIGDQYWMVQNFRCTQYNDGTPIPQVNYGWYILTDGAYCYYDSTESISEQQKWGALYNWYAVNTGKLAPAGWHVPTDAEWNLLENSLIANRFNYDGSTSGNKIAKSMARKTDWRTSTETGAIGNDLTKNNTCSFSALPGGYRGYLSFFMGQNDNGNWWSATDDGDTPSNYAYSRSLNYDESSLRRDNNSKLYGLSVRLVRD